MKQKTYINSILTTDYMRKCLYQMHNDKEWKDFVKHLSTKQIHQLYKSSMERGQLKFIEPKHENEQLDIWDVWGIKF